MLKKLIDTLTCVHRHTVDEHPACFAEGRINVDRAKELEDHYGTPWYTYENMKIGYLDIESDGLKVDFATMLSWCIKEKDGPVHYDVITKEELFDGQADRRIVESCIAEMLNYKIIVTYYGCVTPGHKVLTSKLEWVNVETLKPGDKLIAFDEEKCEGYRSRRFKESEVVHNIPIEKLTYEIELEDGQTLKASADHPWLVQLGGGRRGDRTGYWVWRTTEQLLHNMSYPENPVYMTKMLDVWSSDKSYEAGYLSGYFDSEGSVSFSARDSRHGGTDSMLQVTSSQNIVLNEGIVERVTNYLDEKNYQHSVNYYDKNAGDQVCINITGGLSSKLKFLGSTGLVKNKNIDANRLGRITNCGKLRVVSIKCIGLQTVCGLETTSRTYIVNGFGSHNTVFDMTFLRAKALHYDLYFPGYINEEKELKNGDTKIVTVPELYHFDLFYTAKSKLASLSRKSLDNVCDYLHISGKTPLDKEVWRRAKYGEPSALFDVLQHNIGDVEILEQLHERLTPFNKFTRKGL